MCIRHFPNPTTQLSVSAYYNTDTSEAEEGEHDEEVRRWFPFSAQVGSECMLAPTVTVPHASGA